jgi:hypothetical protein
VRCLFLLIVIWLVLFHLSLEQPPPLEDIPVCQADQTGHLGDRQEEDEEILN